MSKAMIKAPMRKFVMRRNLIGNRVQLPIKIVLRLHLCESVRSSPLNCGRLGSTGFKF